jgi:hypothetical protein
MTRTILHRRRSEPVTTNANTPRSQPIRDRRIEYPASGATYTHDAFAVYEYSTYPRHSVLAGQQRRCFLGEFHTLADAVAAYPSAVVTASAKAVRP